MRKLLVLLMLFSLSLPVGCGQDFKLTVSDDSHCSNQNEKSPAELFLEKTTDKEMESIVANLHYALLEHNSFSSASELNSQELFNFFVCVVPDAQQYYDIDTKAYRFPVPDITNFLNQYFEDYLFIPEEAESIDNYDVKSDSIILTAYGRNSNYFYDIVAKDVLADNQVSVTVRYYDRIDDPDSMDVVKEMRLILKILESGYRYFSYKASR